MPVTCRLNETESFLRDTLSPRSRAPGIRAPSPPHPTSQPKCSNIFPSISISASSIRVALSSSRCAWATSRIRLHSHEPLSARNFSNLVATHCFLYSFFWFAVAWYGHSFGCHSSFWRNNTHGRAHAHGRRPNGVASRFRREICQL
jgi:hypothetical protein